LLRIGTWNLDHAPKARVARLTATLRTNDADIWVLTETRDEVVPSEDMVTIHSAPRPKDSARVRPDSRWVSIWSRHRDFTPVPLVADPSRTAAARIRINASKTMLIYGTVLPWNSDPVHRGAVRKREAVLAQIAEWRELRAAYADDLFCVAGDFNQDMGPGSYGSSKEIVAILREALKDLGLVCLTEPDRLSRLGWSSRVIDHIAVPGELASAATLASAWPADRARLSDHSGVALRLLT